jgi:hypothetical protein
VKTSMSDLSAVVGQCSSTKFVISVKSAALLPMYLTPRVSIIGVNKEMSHVKFTVVRKSWYTNRDE